MRIRTLKPEILTDEKTAGLTDTQWRLFVSCIVMADDYGNFRASPAFLRTQVFWGIDTSLADVAKSRETLARVSLVSLYEVKGQSYGHINGWAKHQRVDHPGKPLCPGQECAESTGCKDSSRDSQETFASVRETLAPDQDQDQDIGPRPVPIVKPKRKKAAEGSDAFEAFWQAYPAHRRMGKAQAIRKWPGDEHAQAVMAHLEAIKASHDWQKDGGEYVLGMRRYLNEEAWKLPVSVRQQSLIKDVSHGHHRATTEQPKVTGEVKL